jgi:hypothetical protein
MTKKLTLTKIRNREELEKWIKNNLKSKNDRCNLDIRVAFDREAPSNNGYLKEVFTKTSLRSFYKDVEAEGLDFIEIQEI